MDAKNPQHVGLWLNPVLTLPLAKRPLPAMDRQYTLVVHLSPVGQLETFAGGATHVRSWG